MIIQELEDYYHQIDDFDMRSCTKSVAEKGTEKYLSQSLIELDCTRTAQGYRLMQTIGYPYRAEIARFLYALENGPLVFAEDAEHFDKQYWIDKLLERHRANLAYEAENPPIFYGEKKFVKEIRKSKDKVDKLPCKRKDAKQTIIPGFGKELTAAERMKKLKAEFGTITFKLNPHKKDNLT